MNSQQCDTILALKLKYGVKQTSVAKNAVNYFDIVYVKITKTKNIYRQKAGQFRREYCRHHYLPSNLCNNHICLSLLPWKTRILKINFYKLLSL